MDSTLHARGQVRSLRPVHSLRTGTPVHSGTLLFRAGFSPLLLSRTGLVRKATPPALLLFHSTGDSEQSCQAEACPTHVPMAQNPHQLCIGQSGCTWRAAASGEGPPPRGRNLKNEKGLL